MEVYCDMFPAHFFIEMCYVREPKFGVIHERNQRFEDAELIRESYGVFNGCYEIAEQIKNTILRNNIEIGMVIPITTISCEFIETIILQIVNGNHCAYNPNSLLNKTTNKFNPLHIQIGKDIKLDIGFVGVIMHELTHAYEDWMRSNNKTERLKGLIYKIGYKKINLDSKDNIDLAFSNLFYFLNEFEKNAYIAQIEGLFNSCDEVFYTIGDAMDWIKNKFPYKHYEQLFSICKTLYDEQDKEKQQIYLTSANTHSNYNFKTYEQLRHWLKVKLSGYKKKFESIIPKMAMSHLSLFESLYNPMVANGQEVSLL